jgi:hypothetical protein
VAYERAKPNYMGILYVVGRLFTSLESTKIVNYKNKKPDGSKDIIRHFEEKELRNSAKNTVSCRVTLIEFKKNFNS